MPVFKSGAFAQQCFSSHPLCLSLKRTDAAWIVISCSSCNILHRVRVRSFTVQEPAVRAVPHAEEARGGIARAPREHSAEGLLQECSTVHQPSVAVAAVDVLHDSVGLRCAECHRSYALAAEEFETFQR